MGHEQETEKMKWDTKMAEKQEGESITIAGMKTKLYFFCKIFDRKGETKPILK